MLVRRNRPRQSEFIIRWWSPAYHHLMACESIKHWSWYLTVDSVRPSETIVVQILGRKIHDLLWNVRGCIRKFPDWSPGARTANFTAATRCSCIAILWISLVCFAAITLCVDSQRMFIVVVYFVIDWVRKLLDTPSCLENLKKIIQKIQSNFRSTYQFLAFVFVINVYSRVVKGEVIPVLFF
jgi:hypothetical protein